MKSGVYNVAGVEHQAADKTLRHYGRLAVINGHTQVLEDTKEGFLASAFPDGLIDDQKQRRWAQLSHSPYFHVTTEGLIDKDADEDLPQPEVKPEESFDVQDAHGDKRLLEAYGENLFLDGKRLLPKEVEEFQRRVHLGELHLLPRHQ